MADSKISDLDPVTALLGTDEFVLARAGDTKKIDASDLTASVSAFAGLSWPAMGYPSSFTGDLDTNFDGSIAPWTAVSGSSGTVSLLETTTTTAKYDATSVPGMLLVQVGHAQLVEFRIDYTLASGESAVMGLFPAGPQAGDNMSVALRLNESSDATSTTGAYVAMMLEQDTTEWVFQANSDADASGQEISSMPMFGCPFVLFRIIRSSTTYSCWYSISGGSWQYLFQRTGVGTPYANVWMSFLGNSSGSTYMPIIAVPFTIKGTDAFLPW